MISSWDVSVTVTAGVAVLFCVIVRKTVAGEHLMILSTACSLANAFFAHRRPEPVIFEVVTKPRRTVHHILDSSFEGLTAAHDDADFLYNIVQRMTRPNGRPLDGLQRVDDQPNGLGVKIWLFSDQLCGFTFALPTQGLITCTAQRHGIDTTIRSVGSVAEQLAEDQQE